MRFDTRQLRHLTAVIQGGSFTRAATSLNMSQPALSKSIHLLEHAVGAKLLERGRRGAKPTPFGQALLERYGKIEAELRFAVDDINALKGLRQGHLTVGATAVTSSYLVPTAISRLKAQKRHIDIDVTVNSASLLVNDLKEGRLDLVVGPIYGEHVGLALEEEFLFNSRLVVISRPGHPLSKLKSVKLDQLRVYDYVGTNGNNPLKQQLDRLFKSANITGFQPAIATNSPAMSKMIVQQSDYFSMLPESVVELEARLKLLRITQLEVTGNKVAYGARWLKDRSINPAMSAFVMELKRTSAHMKKNIAHAHSRATTQFAAGDRSHDPSR